MSAFDFTDVSEEGNSESMRGGFDFFQQQSIPGLSNSTFPVMKQGAVAGSGTKEVPVSSSSSSENASFSFDLGGSSRGDGNRKVETGPQAGVDLQKMRTRRETQIIAARKAKRNNRFTMQRRIGMGDNVDKPVVVNGDEAEDESAQMASMNARLPAPWQTSGSPNTSIHEKIMRNNLAEYCSLVSSNDVTEQHDGVTRFRKILSGERTTNPPSDRVIGCGIMPRIISFLEVGYHMEIQKEACWTISHLACADGDHIGAYLVSNGVIPLLVKLLVSATGNAKERLRETVLSCIGNLSAYTNECRDLLLQSGILVPILTQLGMELQIAEGASMDNGRVAVVKPNTSPSLATMTFLSWSFDNLAKGEPAPPDYVTRQTMLPLSCLLHSPDEKVMLTTMNTLLTLCESSRREVNVQMMLEHGMFKRVYSILASQNSGNGGGTPTSPTSPNGTKRGKASMYGSKELSQLTAINVRELGLRVFAAALRGSTSRLHQLALVCPSRFPHLLEMMVAELARIAEIKPTLGVWGSVRAKGNSFYQGGASEIYKLNSPAGLEGDEEGRGRGLSEEELRRMEGEYDIKLELVSGLNSIISLDTPEDRKYTFRLLDLGVMYALYRAASYNYFNLNVVICHCVSLLLERLDYSQVTLRPSQAHWSNYDPTSPHVQALAMAQGGQLSAADLVIPVVRQAVLLMTQLLPTMRGDLECLMLILHRTTHLLNWSQGLGLLLLDGAEGSDIAEKMQDLPMHSHQDVCSWATTLFSLLEAIHAASNGN